MKFAKRLDSFEDYVFLKYNKIILEVEEKSNKKVLNFGIGSPDFPPSKIYVEKLFEFYKEENAHMYPGYKANTDFENGIITYYKNRFNVRLETDELLPLLGAKDAVSHLPLALLNKNEEILIPDPGYPGFISGALIAEATPIYYSLNKNGINYKDLENKITNKTKCIWVNFPSNPTGNVLTLEELKLLVIFAKKNNLLILYDNAYAEIAFDKFIAPSILQIENAKDIAVEIGSFSKSHSFAGYRMGWIAGNKNVIKIFTKLKSQLDSGMSTPLQKLGGYALNNPDKKWKQEMLESYEKRRNIIAEKFKKLNLEFNIPKGGLYIWAKIPEKEINGEDFCNKLLKEKQVFVAPGSAFGNNGKDFVRISICVNIENIQNYF